MEKKKRPFLSIFITVFITLLLFAIISIIISEALTTDKGWWPLALIFEIFYLLIYSAIYALMTFKFSFGRKYYVVFNGFLGLYFVLATILYFNSELFNTFDLTGGIFYTISPFLFFLISQLIICRFYRIENEGNLTRSILFKAGLISLSALLVLAIIYYPSSYLIWSLKGEPCNHLGSNEYTWNSVKIEVLHQKCQEKGNKMRLYYSLKLTNIGDDTLDWSWHDTYKIKTFANVAYDTFAPENFLNAMKHYDDFFMVEPNDYRILKYHSDFRNVDNKPINISITQP